MIQNLTKTGRNELRNLSSKKFLHQGIACTRMLRMEFGIEENSDSYVSISDFMDMKTQRASAAIFTNILERYTKWDFFYSLE